MKVRSRRLDGRCANGYERDGGDIYHAVVDDEEKAICGAKPRSRSAVWGAWDGENITCEKCLKKLDGTQYEIKPQD